MANAKKLIKEASLFLKIESNRISHCWKRVMV